MRDKDINIRTARRSDIHDVFGKLQNTVKAWVVELNNEVVAVCGVVISPTVMVSFSHIDEDVDVPAITVYRIAKQIMAKIKNMGYKTLYAIADPKHENSKKFLQMLGFTQTESSERGEIFIWQTQ